MWFYKDNVLFFVSLPYTNKYTTRYKKVKVENTRFELVTTACKAVVLASYTNSPSFPIFFNFQYAASEYLSASGYDGIRTHLIFCVTGRRPQPSSPHIHSVCLSRFELLDIVRYPHQARH